jgi:hypothetical protein
MGYDEGMTRMIRLRRQPELLAAAIFWLLSAVALPASASPGNWPTGQAGIGWEEGAEAPTLVSTANRRDCFAAPKAVGRPSLDVVPPVRGGEFNRWFNELTSEEFGQVWSNPALQKAVKARLRHPGGLHEWHLVSRAEVFKRWGVTAEQIQELRTAISDVRFVNPAGRHGGFGSTAAHNELLEIIDSSLGREQFVRRLQNWANYRLEGGVNALPAGL